MPFKFLQTWSSFEAYKFKFRLLDKRGIKVVQSSKSVEYISVQTTLSIIHINALGKPKTVEMTLQ